MTATEFITALGGKYVDEDANGNHDFLQGEYEVYRALAAMIAPRSYLEVGVYCGYSASAVIFGAQNTLDRYCGIDVQMERKDSNAAAADIVRKAFAKTGKIGAKYLFHAWDTQANGVPELDRVYDWVHVDANHTFEGTVKDLVNFWPYAGRVMTMHDTGWPRCLNDACQNVVKENLLPGLVGHFDVPSNHGFRVYVKG